MLNTQPGKLHSGDRLYWAGSRMGCIFKFGLGRIKGPPVIKDCLWQGGEEEEGSTGVHRASPSRPQRRRQLLSLGPTGRIPWRRGDPAPRHRGDRERRHLCFPLSPSQLGPATGKTWGGGGEDVHGLGAGSGEAGTDCAGVFGGAGSRRTAAKPRRRVSGGAPATPPPPCPRPRPPRTPGQRAGSPMNRMGKVMKSRKTCGTTLSASTKQPLLRTPWSTR